MELSREKIKRNAFGQSKTLMQQQSIYEEAMNSGSSSKEVPNLNSKSEDRKYHVQEQAPQGFISVGLPPPEKGRTFSYFIIYILCIDRFQHSFQK